MTEPSERGKRRACEILCLPYDTCSHVDSVRDLARHLDAEDKAAREALAGAGGYRLEALVAFTRRHILPDPKPTVRDVVERWRGSPGRTTEALETMLRDAGLLKETDCD